MSGSKSVPVSREDRDATVGLKRFFVHAAIIEGCAIVSNAGRAGDDATPIFGIILFPGYRDWRLICVAHEAGKLDDLRAVLGNDIAARRATLAY